MRRLLHPFSSLLFVPGDRPDRIEKARASSADLVVIDLEDAVAQDRKDQARKNALESQARPAGQLGIRVNRLASRTGIADLHALADHCPDWLLLPMVEHETELVIVRAAVGPGVRLVPLIETVRGLERAAAIASAPGVAALMFGGGDLSAELGVALAWEPLLVARSLIVMAAAKARIPAIDVPWVTIDDPEGLAEECRRSRQLGFAGKAAIHPLQLDVIKSSFEPTARERSDARAALAAWRQGGGAAVRWNGQMLDAPLIPRLQRIAGETIDA